ncbi:unnamed protein product [Orchesella dallaii]|uniref:Dipeptidyl peptidase 3 n=1 Tax=Orchesella dallaii TaxID=48710 RepID=A0ABP1R9P0_9HEXA
MDAKTLKQYIIPLEQPVVNLDCKEAFNGLSEQEKLYACYLSQASWVGGLIALVQTSPEAPSIFCLLHDLFKSNGVEGLKSLAKGDCDFSEDEWKALLVFTSGFLSNSGNYKGFNDTKIIPGLPLDKLEALVNKAKFMGLGSDALKKWSEIKDKLYSLSEERERQLGLGEKGITTYFSSNCTHDDAELINRFMKKREIEAFITRCFKTVKDEKVSYEIRSASAETDVEEPEAHKFEGCEIRLTRGDYAPLMRKTSEYLEKAKEFASNETEKKMLTCYIDSFTKGSLDAHKDGSRYWIKDKGPIVETYIGFIETYRDPAGTRGEFEGLVSIVNRPMSVKFGSLVEKAPELLKLLPWPKEFEKDVFLKPDFTSLDVVTYSGSKIFSGINIPNYDEIRQSEGFKNVSLGNVIHGGMTDADIPFLSDKDKEFITKYRTQAFEVQVALHELLGHGSGKLLKKNSDGSTNYPSDLKNPLTNDLIESAYEEGDTYDSVFTTIGSAYEECRADCVGLLLCLDKDVLKIFGLEGAKADTIIYTNWLSMVYNGATKALESYQPKTETWTQAHSQGRFVFLQWLIEAGEGLITIVEKTGSDGKPDLDIKLDQTKIDSVGRKAISDLLMRLQIYKATADVKSARNLFEKYSTVVSEGQHPWAKWRDIVLEKKQPEKFFVQCNLSLNADSGKVVLKTYHPSPEGLIQSWIERFPELSIYEDLEYCHSKDKPYFTDY